MLLLQVEVVALNITVSAPVFSGERTNGLELRKGPFGQVPGLGFHCAQPTPKFLKEKQPTCTVVDLYKLDTLKNLLDFKLENKKSFICWFF